MTTVPDRLPIEEGGGNVPDERWEYGSEFHWPDFRERPQAPLLAGEASLWATGRDAFAALIQLGIRQRGWRRWFMPSYLCPHVVAAIVATGLKVERYEDAPCWPAPRPPAVRFQTGDALLLVNYFGLRGREAAGAIDLGPADLIEDHSHDPWSDWARSSAAAYCLASLRKTLPIPDGAALWSPRGLALPERAALTAARDAAAQKKLAAFILKRLYLQGEFADKQVFRGLQLEGESGLAIGPASGATPWTEQLLPSLPWDAWRRQRAANYVTLRQALVGVAGVEVLGSHGGTCPFAVVLACATPAVRQRIRTHLITSAMYPAVHWPIESRGDEALHAAERLSQCLLTLPCDFRYAEADLLRVAETVRRAVETPAGSWPGLGSNVQNSIFAATASRDLECGDLSRL